MKHKHKSKHESESSDESDSSRESSSSDDDRKKSKKHHSSSQDLPSKKKKKYTDSEDSNDDRHKKKTPKTDDEKNKKHFEKTHHSDGRRESSYKEKYDKESNSRRDRFDDRRDNDRRREDNNRHSHLHRRYGDQKDHSRNRDDRERSLDDRRRDRPWNRGRRSRSRSFDHGNARWGKNENDSKSDKNKKEKQKPNFGLSGKLTEETNTYKGVVIKYSEPPEARKPRRRWRLYPFKGEKALQTLYIHRQSAYLIGRERKIADLPVDHPSCSKQHAALQYRLVQFTRDDGSSGKRVRPYIIDLESANGTFVNNKKIDVKKYVELLERDVIKFGFSSREYVLLHENSKDEALDDDVKVEDDEGEVKVKQE